LLVTEKATKFVILSVKLMAMGAAQIREELYQFINNADDRILNLMYGMMKADREKAILTVEQQDDLDKRIMSHKNGESKSYSCSEARAQIEKRA
jgi:hypothetical protein